MAAPDVTKIVSKLKPLLSSLLRNFNTGDYNLRRESAIALSKFKGETATDFLLQNFESDNIQDFMALALGNIESEKAVNLLVNALNDTQSEVRFHAARALGMIKNNEAFNVLMEALNEYADSATTGLAKATQTQVFFEEEAIISAINALGGIKSHLSIPLLKRILAQDKSPRIRASIITALGEMSNERMLPVFQAALRDEDSRVRANAIEAIESIKSSAIVGILQPYLEDPNNRVKANVAKAIWKYGDFDVSDTLVQMIASTDKWQRASAAYAMGEIKDVRFIRRLAAALKDDAPEVRRNAVNALRRIQSADAINHLIPLLEDPHFEVRVQATLAVARCDARQAPDILFARLEVESNPNVRATIVSCLGDSDKPAFRDALERFLDDEDSRVVSNTIDSLEKLSKGSPYPKLSKKIQSLLSHEDNRVKSNAIKALWRWKEFDVLDNLQDLITNKDKKHRQSGIFVMGEIGRAIADDKQLTNAVNLLLQNLLTGKPMDVEEIPIESPPPESTGDAPVEPSKEDASPANKARGKKEAGGESSSPSPVSPVVPATPKAAPEVESVASEPPLLSVTMASEQTFDAEIERAMNAFNAKEYEESEKVYQSILDQQAGNIKALMGIGNLYFIQKRYNLAIDIYRRALNLNPNLVKAHYNLGTIHFYQKDYEVAREHLMTALKLYPKILGAYLILAQIFQMSDKTRESIQLLSKAIELSPRNPILYQKLAYFHFHLKDFSGASQVLAKALQLAPNDVESNLLQAFALRRIDRPADAYDRVEAALNACAQSPRQDESLQVLLQTYMFFKTSHESEES
jgi:HEAT repeat protein/tetratricopeptide (TPR) repeat protein